MKFNKKILFLRFVTFVGVLLTTLFADAEMNDVPMGYRSVGIDTYADKTPVIDGECYALIWMRDGYEFAGIQCDGTLVDTANNDIVYIRSLAKDGMCPPVNFVISEKFRETHPNGLYGVVVLDTRCTKGTLAGFDQNGQLYRVNGWGWAKVRRDNAAKTARMLSATGSLGALIGNSAKLPTNCRRPRITSFAFDAEGNAVVEFKGSERYLSYRISEGKTPEAVGEKKSEELTEGVGDDETAVRIVIPRGRMNGNAGFMRVEAKTDWTVIE